MTPIGNRARCRYAFPSAEEPRVVTPAAVEVLGPSQVQGGQQAAAARVPPGVRRPVRGGCVVDWDGLEALVHHALYDLLGWAVGDEGAVVLAEPLLTPRRDREAAAQIMFEVFNVTGLYVQVRAPPGTSAWPGLGHTRVPPLRVSQPLPCPPSAA